MAWFIGIALWWLSAFLPLALIGWGRGIKWANVFILSLLGPILLLFLIVAVIAESTHWR